MALQLPSISYKGFSVENPYIRPTNIGYNHKTKTITYVLSAYANKAESDSDEDGDRSLAVIYIGAIPVEFGNVVSNLLHTIYEDVKQKAQAEPEEPEKVGPFEHIIPPDPLRDASRFADALDV